MFSWKQRLYAFLLKRLLGPYLSVESQQQLYTRIDQISLTEGTYVFSDLSFDTNFISSKLKQEVVFRIVSATVRKIQIDIKLQDETDNDLSQQWKISSEGSSSFAWKAFKFGIDTASSTNASIGDDKSEQGWKPPTTIALLVQVRLEGLTIVLEPNTYDGLTSELEPMKEHNDTPTSSKSSYLSSFLEAALASVRLSVEMLDARLQFREAGITIPLRQRLLEFRIQSLLYKDGRGNPTIPVSSLHNDESLVEQNHSTYETIVHKVLEVTRLTVLTGTRSLDEIAGAGSMAVCFKSVGLLDGTTCCSLRVIEYRNISNDSNSIPAPFMQESAINACTQHDFQITMNQRLNLSVDMESLQSVRAVVHSYFTDHAPSNKSFNQAPSTQSMVAAATLHQHIKHNVDEDDADFRALEGIMAQYREARFLVEKREMRGGILVPSIDEGGDATFDAFFDTNEESYMRYSSVLRDSVLGSVLYEGSQNQPLSNLIRTKFTLHLQEGGIKLSFPSSCSDMLIPNEYVLLTFTDVNLACQLSSQCTEYTVSIQQVELEDCMLDRYADNTRNEVIGFEATPAVEVGIILRFVPNSEYDDDEDEMDLLIEAPCVSVSFKVDREDTKDLMTIDVVVGPLEVAYRFVSISKLCQVLQTNVQHNPPVLDVIKPKHKTVSLTATCSSLTVLLPLKSGLDLINIYQRTGYTAECVLGRDPALGCCIERLYVEFSQTDEIDKHCKVSISCHDIVAFLSCPITRHNAFDYGINRLDVLTVSGQAEADPCIVIAVTFTPPVTRDISCDDGSCHKTLAQSLFPTVPSFSSFKNRQDDEDDDMPCVKPSYIEGHYGNLNSGDPQSVMLFDASFSDVVVAVNIRDIFVDISVKEVLALHEMTASFQRSETSPSALQATPVEHVSQKRVAYSLVCDRFSLSFQVDGDRNVHSFEDEMVQSSTFLLTMEQCRGYSIAVGSSLKHLRCSAHDFDFIEILNICQQALPTDITCVKERIRAVRQRGSCRPESKTVPILYRSHLFTPMSPISPSFLLDCLHMTDNDQVISSRTLYIYLYNVTYRHEYDSKWINRLCSILPHHSTESSKSDALVLRVFLSIADCNFDYSSALRFKTASRIVLRVGDLRVSSNLVTPRVANQAVCLSLGDVELLVCCNRFPYNFDNSRLLNGSAVMKYDEISLFAFGLLDTADASDILRCMNYRTMLTMASIDAVIVKSTEARPNIEPSVNVTLTLGQICLLACRDSFSHLLASIGEGCAEITAITADRLESLKLMSSKDRVEIMNASARVNECPDDTPKKRADMPLSVKKCSKSDSTRDFLLDGYDWTAIDSEEIGKPGIPSGDEQSARWYGESGSSSVDSTITTVGTDRERVHTKGPPIIKHHFQLHPVADPISDGDMGAAKYTDSNIKPLVHTRIVVHDLALRIRFFDGYDWPELLDESERNAPKCEFFLIPEVKKPLDENPTVSASDKECDGSKFDRKSKLMGDLLSDTQKLGGTFDNIPLPEEHSKKLKELTELRRLGRRTNKFFQIDFSGVVARLDDMEDCVDHRLVSCLNLSLHDFFIAETISSDKPVKMVGEWFNEQEHPRDSNDGLILMKMVTWHPLQRVTPVGEIANDESDVAIKMLPLRCYVDQRAVSFVRAFFNSKENDEGSCLPPHLYAVPPPLFTMFRVQPLKLKVDYRPQKLDTKALRSGDIVELINLSPLDGMVLTLKSVSVVNEVGFGAAVSLVVRRWVEDICATQLHKFVTKSRAFEPITEVSHAATDIVVLPWEALKNGESIQKALRAGTKSFSKAVMFELLNTTSRVAGFVGNNVSRITASAAASTNTSQRTGGDLLPTRPVPMPRSILETGPHAVESLARGLQEATYTVVIVPYREYHRTGATGAVQSVIKGIPVAIVAPTSGVAEALSYTLLGARNQIRPDIRKEDEASLRGLHPT